MKRAGILLFLLFLFIIPYVSAQDSYCQYGFTESYSENEMVLTYEDSNVISGKVPIFSDFAKGNKSSSFMVFNPNDYDILIVFNYTVEGHGGGNKAYGLKVLPNSYGKARENCYADGAFGECNINQSTLKYFILKPQIMYPKDFMINKTREVCCTNGQKNCSDSCITPSTKTAGEAYRCDWECQSGVGNGVICKWNDGHLCIQPTDCLSGKCNIAGVCGDFVQCPNGTQSCNDKVCVKPLNKTVGEAYSCIWECATRAGKDGVCQMSLIEKAKRFFIFVAIIGLIFAVAQYFHRKGNKARMVAETKKEQEKIIEEAKKKQEQITKEHNERIKNAENKLATLTRELQEKRQYTEAEIKELNRKKEELRQYISEQRESVKHELEQWQKVIPFPDEQVKGRLVIRNPYLGGYKCFYQGKDVLLERYNSSTLVHRWVWKEHNGRWPKAGYHIHHKDEDKFNNDTANLEEIEGDEHFRIHKQNNL